ncbi:DUF2796 domain-containing protein [Litoribrevibacter albus]|uniref:DUF2796 domain-containing protein n=1 Tax=Litoribrevibacter albus TaxID=1473156 RepID=A0AA37SB03_9GAMM|nr:DUF2796 domain-containing protein [Litoribrevibacter albus]GLQ32640.1 hypothetical protein GCM10007876_31190 [Litoribrevibacter albus]
MKLKRSVSLSGAVRMAGLFGLMASNGVFAELTQPEPTQPDLSQQGLRQHQAHEHGHAILNAAQEGNEVELSFEIPAMDMVGFEHQPETQAQKDQIEIIHAFLQQGQNVVSFNEEAHCQFEQATIESALLSGDDHEHHEENNHHEEHGQHDGHHGMHQDHDDERTHKEHDHEEENGHSEFEITYHVECADPSELAELNILLFKQVPTLQEIEANWFGETAVKKSELTPNQPSMDLR